MQLGGDSPPLTKPAQPPTDQAGTQPDSPSTTPVSLAPSFLARNDIRVWLLLFGSFAVVAAISLVRSRGLNADDAFIFYRYARNIGSGHGWVFNPGETTANAATSPLWAALLAAVGTVAGYGPGVGQVLYMLSLAGAATFLCRLLATAGSPIAGVVGGLMLVLNPLLLSSIGMESALFVVLCTALLWADQTKHSEVVIGVLGGVLTLARPEGAILFGILWLLRWWSTSALPVKRTVALLASMVPWIVYSTIAFGSPLAETLAAKSAQGRSGYFGPPFVYLRYIRTVLARPWSLALVVLALVGALVVAVTILRNREATKRAPLREQLAAIESNPLLRCALVVTAFAGLHTIAYGLIIRPPAYAWYYATPYLAATVLAAVACGELVHWLLARVSPPDGSGGAGSRALRLAALAAAAVVVITPPALMVSGQLRGDLYCGYDAAGNWIEDHTAPRASVAAAEIGVMGWVSKRPIVDYLGLLDPKSAEEIGTGDLRTWVERTKPDLYIAHIPVWDMEVPSITSQEFQGHYRPVAEIHGVGWSSVRVYERVDAKDAKNAGASDAQIIGSTLSEALAANGTTLAPDQESALSKLVASYVADPTAQKIAETNDGVNFDALRHYDDQLTDSPRATQWTTLGGALDGLTAPLGAPLPPPTPAQHCRTT